MVHVVLIGGGLWGLICCGCLWRWDAREHRLPNRWTGLLALGGFVTAGVVCLLAGTVSALIGAVLGAAGYALSMGVLRLLSRGQLGMGDVKLAVGLGAYTGLWGLGVTAVAALLGVVLGGLAALGAVVLGRARIDSSLPYGPPMMLGAFGALVLAAT
ncbi:leader peptidase (prepilin peptidase)/N-methyltransferase [Micrococcus cohnii]|uniref:Leader peptidase (Prepilin peptidase)/N-methyltransferase n=1 Tax=Micrococcus cohnii TaxID=993416 RepID=A0A7W7M1V6_9MICC|nr:leader peptidase (prepilin peptidase)/N-methyltransferase [Micrococcus cohnii]